MNRSGIKLYCARSFGKEMSESHAMDRCFCLGTLGWLMIMVAIVFYFHAEKQPIPPSFYTSTKMLLEQTKQLKSNQPHRWWWNMVRTQTGFPWLSKPHRVCSVFDLEPWPKQASTYKLKSQSTQIEGHNCFSKLWLWSRFGWNDAQAFPYNAPRRGVWTWHLGSFSAHPFKSCTNLW